MIDKARAARIAQLNAWANCWRFDIGANVFPADSRNKVTYEKWKENGWQTGPISEEQHEFWRDKGTFENGLMVMPGTPWHKPEIRNLFLICIDWDKELGFNELFEGKTLDQVYEEHFIEQHSDDLTRGHFWFYSPIAFPKKNPDDILGLEVKGLASHGVMISTPSIHNNGSAFEVMGIHKPKILTKEEAFNLLLHLNKICKKHSVPYLDKNGRSASPLSVKLKNMIKNLALDTSIKIVNGTRHDLMVSIADSILLRHSRRKSHEKLQDFFFEINSKSCVPDPLPDNEVSRIWQDALEYVSRVQEQEQTFGEKNSPVGYNDNKHNILLSIHDENIRKLLVKDIWTIISENP